jgi:colanic acid biosynthesis glycosyl transferase WcaI
VRVLVLSQFYAPDEAAGTQFLVELCEHLVRHGHEVEVVTSRTTNHGGPALAPSEDVGGVQVTRAWSTSLGKAHLVHRLSDYGTFFASAIVKTLMARRVDLLLSVTVPPLIPAVAALASRLHHTPLVTWVQDVYPDVAVELGVLRRESPVVTALAALQRQSLGQCARVVAISEGMSHRLEAHGASRASLRVIHNWSDGAHVVPRGAGVETPFRLENGLAGRFVLTYSGNLGMAHEFETLVSAARALEADPRFLLLFIGAGGRLKEARAMSAGASNVRFLPFQPAANLGQSLTAADAHAITLRTPLEGLIVPSKLYGALACGKPLFYVGPERCEVARVIESAGLGWAGRPGDVDGLVGALRRALDDPRWAAECGERARAAFDSSYAQAIALEKWRTLLEETAAAGTRSAREGSSAEATRTRYQ